jgi:hypothetical protein
MATGLGYKAFVGFGTEGTYGTGTASTAYLELNAGGDSVSVAEEFLNSGSIKNAYRDDANCRQGAITASGSFTFDLRYAGAEKLLKYGMGAGTVTQPEGTTLNYLHTYTLTDEISQAMSFSVSRDLNAFRLEGGMINSLTFNCSNTGFMTCTANIVGEDMGTLASETITAPTAPLIPFSDVTCTYAGTLFNVQDFSITIENNLDVGRRFIGSRLIKQPLRNGKVEVSGSVTFEFDALTQYNNFRANTSTTLVFTAQGVLTGVGATSKWGCVFTMNKARLTTGVPVANNEGRIMLPCNFKAYAAGTGTREIIIALTNTTATD